LRERRTIAACFSGEKTRVGSGRWVVAVLLASSTRARDALAANGE